MICAVCRQPKNPERAAETALDALVFGVAPYAVCCACGLPVRQRHDQTYRRRWRRWAKASKEAT